MCASCFGFPFRARLSRRRAGRERGGTAAAGAVYWAGCSTRAHADAATTQLMLAAMSDRSFVVVYAYIKTEAGAGSRCSGLLILGRCGDAGMARRS